MRKYFFMTEADKGEKWIKVSALDNCKEIECGRIQLAKNSVISWNVSIANPNGHKVELKECGLEEMTRALLAEITIDDFISLNHAMFVYGRLVG